MLKLPSFHSFCCVLQDITARVNNFGRNLPLRTPNNFNFWFVPYRSRDKFPKNDDLFPIGAFPIGTEDCISCNDYIWRQLPSADFDTLTGFQKYIVQGHVYSFLKGQKLVTIASVLSTYEKLRCLFQFKRAEKFHIGCWRHIGCQHM